MKRATFAFVILLSAVLSAQAYAGAADNGSQTPASDAVKYAALQQAKKVARKPSAAPASSPAVTYNHDSKDPNIGWHWENGERVCHQDCDNPEIPGSGYTCRDVQFLGMAMRECDSTN
jgi:hypothetical protein